MMAIIGMFFQDGLTGSAWGDWALYTASPLRAFESELGVQAPVGFWDPLGFTADGDVAAFRRRRSVELKHGRISMLATMGYITPEVAGKFPGFLSPSAGLKYADIPNGLAAVSKVPTLCWTPIMACFGCVDFSGAFNGYGSGTFGRAAAGGTGEPASATARPAAAWLTLSVRPPCRPLAARRGYVRPGARAGEEHAQDNCESGRPPPTRPAAASLTPSARPPLRPLVARRVRRRRPLCGPRRRGRGQDLSCRHLFARPATSTAVPARRGKPPSGPRRPRARLLRAPDVDAGGGTQCGVRGEAAGHSLRRAPLRHPGDPCSADAVARLLRRPLGADAAQPSMGISAPAARLMRARARGVSLRPLCAWCAPAPEA
jgi:hypothetical protein